MKRCRRAGEPDGEAGDKDGIHFHQGFGQRGEEDMISVQGLIKEIDNLKPIPQIASRVMKMSEDPECSLRDIADVILHDPLITANLLRICNAAYFGLPRQIDSVQDAITLLGLQKIVDLVLLKCCTQALGREQRGYGLHEGELWRARWPVRS
jgi:HD-like signal output (HDOD) protein